MKKRVDRRGFLFKTKKVPMPSPPDRSVAGGEVSAPTIKI
jgi:hypothetical protein